MQKVLWFFLGTITLAVVVAAGGLIFLKTGADGFSTRSQPSAMERFAARQTREMASPPGARERRNAVAESPEILAEGRIVRTTEAGPIFRDLYSYRRASIGSTREALSAGIKAANMAIAISDGTTNK